MCARAFPIAAACFILALHACSRGDEIPITAHEVTGDSDHRVEVVSRMLRRKTPLPTEILDAHFLQETIGDDFLGPADYRTYCVVRVPGTDIEKWTRLLNSSAERAGYPAPEQPRGWWVTEEDFQRLHFYGPSPLASFMNGWIGVSPAKGEIYIYSFTT
jgi:hypothetical protein